MEIGQSSKPSTQKNAQNIVNTQENTSILMFVAPATVHHNTKNRGKSDRVQPGTQKKHTKYCNTQETTSVLKFVVSDTAIHSTKNRGKSDRVLPGTQKKCTKYCKYSRKHLRLKVCCAKHSPSQH